MHTCKVTKHQLLTAVIVLFEQGCGQQDTSVDEGHGTRPDES
jgi:hypothetical protein